MSEGGSEDAPSDETAATSEAAGDTPTDETHPEEAPKAEPEGDGEVPATIEGAPDPTEQADEASGDSKETEPGEATESSPPADESGSVDAVPELKETEFPPIEPVASDEGHDADQQKPVSFPLEYNGGMHDSQRPGRAARQRR